MEKSVKGIIEKLGLKTPDELKIVGDVWMAYELAGLPRPHVSNDLFFEQGKQLKKILDERNEMLEALIESMNKWEMFHEESMQSHPNVKLIEKATGKTWTEIKAL